MASIEVGDRSGRVDGCFACSDRDEMNIGWIKAMMFEDDDLGCDGAVMVMVEIVWQSRMSLLIDHLEGEQSEVDHHVLHRDGMDRQVCFVLDVYMDKWLWLVTRVVSF